MKHSILRSGAAAFFLAAAALLSGCKSTTALNNQAPAAQPVKGPVYERKLSSITVPVSFPMAALESKLNQELKGVLYKDENAEDDNVAVIVTKKGNLTIKAENDKLYFTLPLNIWVKGYYKWKACDMCPALEKSEATQFDLTVKSQSMISLTEDYKVKTVTVGDFEWGNTKPVLELGPLKIGLARFVEPVMKQQMGTISQQLDAEIQKRVNIKNYIKEAWVEVQKPIQLDKGLDAWLVITPKDIRITPLQLRNGQLNMKIGLTSYIETVTNGKPKVKVNQNLPKLITDKNLTDAIQIGLTGEIPYTHATKLLKDQIGGKTFTFEGGKDKVTINDASVSASGDQLLLMLDVNGQTKAGLFTKKIVGKVFLKATPYYDAETATIRVKDVDYDIETKDKLLSTASWLAKNKLREQIQAQINFPVKDQLNEAKKMVQTSLDQNSRVHESVLLKGRITDIVPDNIYLTPTSIKAVVNAKGNLSVMIDKL